VLADPALPATDPWRHPFRLTASERHCRVRSAGVDGAWDTCDDVEAECMPHWRP